MLLSLEEEKKEGEVSMARALCTCERDSASVMNCLVGALDPSCHAQATRSLYPCIVSQCRKG